ncbi:hypothetical protein ARMSODRAFT_296980 [Armillaria solidipes]|uniref:Uncharacterized protein n=1 Tax=Armillaria solidipes TaxID=1076256 RepID=A0A2H3BSX0_9AGAR|nr:hypothetical protein ARMSODRAFT_296980 [Armillaria solidipes]
MQGSKQLPCLIVGGFHYVVKVLIASIDSVYHLYNKYWMVIIQFHETTKSSSYVQPILSVIMSRGLEGVV